MTNQFNNPWFDLVIEQMWIVRQATETAARSIDPELLTDPQALTDYCLHPTEERLNPLEFHGKRRSPAGNHERGEVPRADRHNRAS